MTGKPRSTRVVLALAAAACGLGLAPPAQAALRAEKNHRLVSDPHALRGKDAVGLAVNPGNPQHIVQINADWNLGDCEYTRSLDGGATWSVASAFTAPAGFVDTCQVGGHLGQAIDRGVAFGTGQNVYATFAAPKSGLLADEGSGVLVAKSTDGGATFAEAVVALAGGPTASPGPNYGLPKLAVDPGAGTGGADRIYVVAGGSTQGQSSTVVTVSNDGGTSWTSPVNANPVGQNAVEQTQPVVHSDDHSVSVGWRSGGTIVVSRSTNAGQSWSTPVVAAQIASAVSYPRLAGKGPNLYLVYGQEPAPTAPAGGFQGADHFIDLDMDVYFQRSLDHGAKWAPPKLINENAPKPGTALTQTRHADVSVAPNGRVDIVWQDRRHWYDACPSTHGACDEARLGDTYYSFSHNAGSAPAASVTFSPNHRVTDRSHNNDVGFDYRFGTYWDFGPVSVPLGNDKLLVGWMDSREGSFETDTQDIYLSTVDHSAPAAVPQQTIPQSGTQGLALALSQHTYPGGGEGLLDGTFVTRGGTSVVIAAESDVPGILAAGVLARANLSQVLVSPASGLPPAVASEVARMSPAGAYVVGNTTQLSSQVEQDLEAAGVPNDSGQIKRLGGADPAETAALVAAELDRRTQAEKDANTPAFDAVVVANPDSPDAAAASALASARRLPILFTHPSPAVTTLPAPTSQAIAAQDVGKALVIGGTQWVNGTVEGLLPSPKRLSGADQYGTSKAVVTESVERGLPTNIAYVVDGARPVDAALVGSAAGRSSGLLLLSQAPLGASAPAAAASAGLGELDRLLLVQPPPAVPDPPVPPPSPPPPASSLRSGSPADGPGAGSAAPARHRCAGRSRAGNLISLTRRGDRSRGTRLADLIFGGRGDDAINGLGGNDCIDLGAGRDRGQGGSGNDVLVGGSGNDLLRGSAGGDRLIGSSGKDRLAGNSGRDSLLGGSGGDRLSGGSGNDRLAGGSGPDRLFGGSGGDRLSGGPGGDRMSGGRGNDRIRAADGRRDRIVCGPGRDRVLADRFDRVARTCERVRRR